MQFSDEYWINCVDKHNRINGIDVLSRYVASSKFSKYTLRNGTDADVKYFRSVLNKHDRVAKTDFLTNPMRIYSKRINPTTGNSFRIHMVKC